MHRDNMQTPNTSLCNFFGEHLFLPSLSFCLGLYMSPFCSGSERHTWRCRLLLREANVEWHLQASVANIHSSGRRPHLSTQSLNIANCLSCNNYPHPSANVSAAPHVHCCHFPAPTLPHHPLVGSVCGRHIFIIPHISLSTCGIIQIWQTL